MDELIGRGWTVTLLAERFENIPAHVRTVELQGLFRRDLLSLGSRAHDVLRIFQLTRTASKALVIVQGDLPRVIYVVLQWIAPLIFIRQDGILTCPGNNRFLARDRSMCNRRAGLHCLRVHQAQGCIGGLSRLKQIGRVVFRIRDGVLLRCIRNFVANSNYVAKAHERTALVLYPPRNSHCATRNENSQQRGIERTEPKLRSERQRQKSGRPILAAAEPARDRTQLVFCGRLEPVKGAEDALEILRLLPKPFHMEILGEGPERARLEHLARELGLGLRVRFWGWVDAAQRDCVFGSSGALLLPSLWDEAFGMVGIEALAQGTPVVAYDVGGISEWCAAEAGVLVPCGDIRAAAAAVIALTSDSVRWERYSHAARRVAQLFPTERFGRELDAILDVVCK